MRQLLRPRILALSKGNMLVMRLADKSHPMVSPAALLLLFLFSELPYLSFSQMHGTAARKDHLKSSHPLKEQGPRNFIQALSAFASSAFISKSFSFSL